MRDTHETLLEVIDNALDLPLAEAATRLVDSIFDEPQRACSFYTRERGLLAGSGSAAKGKTT